MGEMLKQRFLRFASNFLVASIVTGVFLLSYSVFADSYATDRTLPPAPIESTPPITAPRLDIVSGLANDESLILGPWPIVSSLANLQLTNGTKDTFIVSISLTIDMAMCLTSREISITIGNRTRVYSLSSESRTARQTVQFEIKTGQFYNLTVQVAGPVCQIDSDPRLFYGSLAFNNFKYYPAKEFAFK